MSFLLQDFLKCRYCSHFQSVNYQHHSVEPYFCCFNFLFHVSRDFAAFTTIQENRCYITVQYFLKRYGTLHISSSCNISINLCSKNSVNSSVGTMSFFSMIRQDHIDKNNRGKYYGTRLVSFRRPVVFNRSCTSRLLSSPIANSLLWKIFFNGS